MNSLSRHTRRYLPFLLISLLTTGWATESVSQADSTITMSLQRRSAETGEPVVKETQLDPSKVGIVMIDVWDYHWCMTYAHRVASLIPRMNALLASARQLGMKVFWAPTDCVLPYFGTPQRERAAAVPYHEIPQTGRKLHVNFTCGVHRCSCGPGFHCVMNYGMDAQHPDAVVAEDDYFISGTTELYSLFQELGLTHLIYMGFATNMCLFGKPPALQKMYEAGIDCILARDATDAFTSYQPNGAHPDKGTAQCVADIERGGIPTIHMAQEMQRAGVWEPEVLTEPVLLTPWGTQDWPYLFDSAVTVTLTTPWLDGVTYRYTVDGSEPTIVSAAYTQPLKLTSTTELRTAAFRQGKRVSLLSEGYFVRLGAIPPQPDVKLADCQRITTMPDRYGWLPKINQSWEGYALTMRGTEYSEGLGCRAPTQLLYEIKPEYERFVALAGVDDGFIGRGVDPSPGVYARRVARYPSVVFKVFIDGELAGQSPTMRVSAVPWRFDVPIPRGARRISLVLNSTGSRHPLDCGNWVDAGFVLSGPIN